jgi:hypothetical protein
MEDETTRLAARLARQEGKTHPMDWVETYERHTAFEWLIQMVLARLDPWGDDRADMREARNAAHVVAATVGMTDEEKFHELVESLRDYLPHKKEPEKVVGARALRQALGDA